MRAVQAPLTTHVAFDPLRSPHLKGGKAFSLFNREWLGLPRCLSGTELYRRGVLKLAEEFKCANMRMEMTLLESTDPLVAQFPQLGYWQEVQNSRSNSARKSST